MGGKKQPATTTQINKTELPAWVDAASQSNYAMASNDANQDLYSNYDVNQRYVNPSGTTTAADTYYRQNMNAADPIYGEALAGFRGLMDYDAADITGTSYQAQTLEDKLKAGDLATYMNPYLNQVESGALRSIDDQRKSALQQNASKAVGQKSFGGSRSAIVDALTNSESAKAAGDISNQIRAAGFQTATGLMGGDVAASNAARQFEAMTGMQAKTANQAADIQSAGIRGQASDRMQGAAKDMEASNMQKYMTQLGMGMREDELAQRRADFSYDQYMQRLQEPLNDLNIRLSALGMSPYGKTETQTKTGSSEKQGTDWATFGLGALKMLPSLFAMSEDDTKTDVEKVGLDPSSGLTLYAYRYKKDPKTYPKVVGPMASDIEEMNPTAIKTVGGKRLIDLNALNW